MRVTDAEGTKLDSKGERRNSRGLDWLHVKMS